MKILFAVSNENVSKKIVESYQQKYNETVSFKNVFYFNAIIREIKNDKTYDRIVISEDLEPFANNNFEVIDRFILERLKEISYGLNALEKIPDVVVICTDRRNKAGFVLSKMHEYGIYNALVGTDRRIDTVCDLLYRPRTSQEAKEYYQIEGNGADTSSVDDVTEQEVQNILIHYKRLGKNEDRYTDSFNNIASQYTDKQLKIIIKCLPINVRAVLEAESPKYQELITYADETEEERAEKAKIQEQRRIEQIENERKMRAKIDKEKKEAMKMAKKEPAQVNQEPKQPMATGIDLLDNRSRQQRMTGNVVIPNAMNVRQERKVYSDEELQNMSMEPRETRAPIQNQPTNDWTSNPTQQVQPINLPEVDDWDSDPFAESVSQTSETQPSASLPGFDDMGTNPVSQQPVVEEQNTSLPGLDDWDSDPFAESIPQQSPEVTSASLPGFDDMETNPVSQQPAVEEQNTSLPGLDDWDSDPFADPAPQSPSSSLPGLDDFGTNPVSQQPVVEGQNASLPGLDDWDEIQAMANGQENQSQSTSLPGLDDWDTDPFAEPVSRQSQEVASTSLPGFDNIESNVVEQTQPVTEEQSASLPGLDDWDNIPSAVEEPVSQIPAQSASLPGLDDWDNDPFAESVPQASQPVSEVASTSLPGFDDIEPSVVEQQQPVAEAQSASLPGLDDWDNDPFAESVPQVSQPASEVASTSLPGFDDIEPSVVEQPQPVAEEQSTSLPGLDDWDNIPSAVEEPVSQTPAPSASLPDLDEWDNIPTTAEEPVSPIPAPSTSLPGLDEWDNIPVENEQPVSEVQTQNTPLPGFETIATEPAIETKKQETNEPQVQNIDVPQQPVAQAPVQQPVINLQPASEPIATQNPQLDTTSQLDAWDELDASIDGTQKTNSSIQENPQIQMQDVAETPEVEVPQEPKRGRGRPRKYPIEPPKPKRKRGRPRKNPLPDENVALIEKPESAMQKVEPAMPPMIQTQEPQNTNLPEINVSDELSSESMSTYDTENIKYEPQDLSEYATNNQVDAIASNYENYNNTFDNWNSIPSIDEQPTQDTQPQNDWDTIPEIDQNTNQAVANDWNDLSNTNQAVANDWNDLSNTDQAVANDWNDLSNTNQAVANDWNDLSNTNQAAANDWNDLSNTNQALANDWNDLSNTNQAVANDWNDLSSTNQAVANNWNDLSNTNQAIANDLEDLSNIGQTNNASIPGLDDWDDIPDTNNIPQPIQSQSNIPGIEDWDNLTSENNTTQEVQNPNYANQGYQNPNMQNYNNQGFEPNNNYNNQVSNSNFANQGYQDPNMQNYNNQGFESNNNYQNQPVNQNYANQGFTMANNYQDAALNQAYANQSQAATQNYVEQQPQAVNQNYIAQQQANQSLEKNDENRVYSTGMLNSVLTKDKKVVAFVGASKNGTSFLVNSLASLFSSIGVKTAILDMTQNKNSFFIYTSNDDKLRNIAYTSIENLERGTAEGIRVDRNLDVYTAIPHDGKDYSNAEAILSTLAQNYSLVLIDCDLKTDPGYFANAQEIYLVQSMDILTIQPLTAFLRDLKTKGILDPDKLTVVINKETKVRGLTSKAIIGGISFYNDPTMSFMTELFNKDKVRACSIPFDENIYSKYLESIVNCVITISGYNKSFMNSLKMLGNMVYPLLSKQTYGGNQNPAASYGQNFSNEMNDTLNQMKNNF